MGRAGNDYVRRYRVYQNDNCVLYENELKEATAKAKRLSGYIIVVDTASGHTLYDSAIAKNSPYRGW
jgi:hypothetical protein